MEWDHGVRPARRCRSGFGQSQVALGPEVAKLAIPGEHSNGPNPERQRRAGLAPSGLKTSSHPSRPPPYSTTTGNARSTSIPRLASRTLAADVFAIAISTNPCDPKYANGVCAGASA